MIVVSVLIFLKFDITYSHVRDLGEKEYDTMDFQDVVSVVASGDRTSLVEHPYNIKFLNDGSLCGGVIITAKHVLTAAHCFDGNSDLTEMKVLSSTDSETSYAPELMLYDVWHYEVHDKYGVGATFANDIAMLIIHNQLTFSKKVKKAILVEHDEWMSEKENNFIVTGWGDTENLGGHNYQILRKAQLRYISPENCSRMSQLELTPDMFCLFGDEKRGSTRGDSGGGVLWNGMIVGIVSYGQNISVPGAYANVFYFLSWIKYTKQMLLSKFCDFHRGPRPNHQYRHHVLRAPKGYDIRNFTKISPSK